MSAIKSWEVSEGLWEAVESLIPKPRRSKKTKYKRKTGGGRKSIPPKKVFEAIVFVLRTGIQWKELPKSYGSSSSVPKYFHFGQRRGFSIGSGRRDWLSMTRWRGLLGSGKVLMGRGANSFVVEPISKNPRQLRENSSKLRRTPKPCLRSYLLETDYFIYG